MLAKLALRLTSAAEPVTLIEMDYSSIRFLAGKIMLDHLLEKFGPSYTNEDVLRELKPMFLKLEQANCPRPSFQDFCTIADFEYLNAEMTR